MRPFIQLLFLPMLMNPNFVIQEFKNDYWYSLENFAFIKKTKTKKKVVVKNVSSSIEWAAIEPVIKFVLKS